MCVVVYVVVMLLWLRYLKELEMACSSALKLSPDGASSVKTMSEFLFCFLKLTTLFCLTSNSDILLTVNLLYC